MDGNENENTTRFLDQDLLSFEFILDSAAINALSLGSKALCPRPARTSAFSSAAYTKELLACGHDDRIKEVLRM
jgi:hypothetical protein